MAEGAAQSGSSKSTQTFVGWLGRHCHTEDLISPDTCEFWIGRRWAWKEASGRSSKGNTGTDWGRRQFMADVWSQPPLCDSAGWLSCRTSFWHREATFICTLHFLCVVRSKGVDEEGILVDTNLIIKRCLLVFISQASIQRCNLPEGGFMIQRCSAPKCLFCLFLYSCSHVRVYFSCDLKVQYSQPHSMESSYYQKWNHSIRYYKCEPILFLSTFYLLEAAICLFCKQPFVKTTQSGVGMFLWGEQYSECPGIKTRLKVSAV